jgi:hypothetical protein
LRIEARNVEPDRQVETRSVRLRVLMRLVVGCFEDFVFDVF